MFGHDPQHTGVAGESVEPPLELLWEFNISSSIASSPVVSRGTVYIVTRGWNDSYLYALDTVTGTERWKWKCEPTGFSFDIIPSPAVYDDTVYTCSGDRDMRAGYLHALDVATGVEKWKYRTDRIRSSSPIVYGHTVYLCTDDWAYALDATTGAERWKYKTGSPVDSSPAVSDNTVYIGTKAYVGIDDAGDVHVDGYVCALDAITGAEKWKYMAGRIYWDWSSPAVYRDAVYICADDCVYALDAITGENEWKYRTGDNISSSPAVCSGTVYIGSQDRYVYALDATAGEVEWKYKTGGSIYSTPVISGETVYIVSTDGYLHALDAITGKKKGKYIVDFWAWTQYRLFSKRSSPAVSENTIYINSDSSYVFALAPYDTSTLATKLVAAISQNTTLFVISIMLFGIICIFYITYFIQRNYKSKIDDWARVVIGLFVASIIWHIWEPNLNFATQFGLLIPSKNHVVAMAMIIVSLVWVFIGLKSKRLRTFVGHLLIICSVILMQCAVIQMFSDPFIRFEIMDTAARYFWFLVLMSVPLIAILIGSYLDETGFIKKVRKYLNYLYKEKVILGANTKKHKENRREDPNRDEREHKAHNKRDRSAKDDTRPYYYKVLDVSTDASHDEIKNAYRRLSMLYHPDTSTDPDAEKKMKEINKAYDVLSDPDKRARYDNFENTFKG
jgi:outer membrane protein assembly factor BamB